MKYNPTTTADRVADYVERRNAVERRKCADPERRARLEADPADWLKWYLAEAYPRPFERPHHELIDGAMAAHLERGRFCEAGERGVGKSAILWGLTLMLSLTGKERFPVCCPWKKADLTRALKFWRTALCFNKRIADDYPEIAAPFVHSKGVAQRLASLTWQDTSAPCGCQLALGDGLIVFPDSLGGLGGATINGNPRGLNLPLADGSIIRPTLALLDDVQDREVAKSETQVQQTVEIIDGDVAGMGEAGKDLAMFMAGNCICENDVMEHYLTSSSWKSVRVPCVEEFPEGWGDGHGDTGKLAREWYEMLTHGEDHVRFWTENRQVLETGWKLSCPSVFAGDELSPVQCVIRTYFKMGHESFWSEKQQQPVKKQVGIFNISYDLLTSRIDHNRKPFELPSFAKSVLTVGTDINHYGLHAAMIGFGNDSSAAPIWYGNDDRLTVPMNVSQHECESIVFKMLVNHGRMIKDFNPRPNAWGIDGGYQLKTVLRYITEGEGRNMPFPVFAMRGYSSDNYRPFGKNVIGKPKERCHLTQWQTGRGIAWDADYWREVSQRAWLGEIGQPGAMSIFGGNHRDLFDQVLRERLAEKIAGQTGTFYKWHTAPGRHDYGDAINMAFVLGAFVAGIGPGANGQPKEKPKVYIPVSRPSQRKGW